MNPINFNINQFVTSVYSGKVYQIVAHKNGMSVLKNMDTGRNEDWNSCNNPHFKKAEQLKLF